MVVDGAASVLAGVGGVGANDAFDTAAAVGFRLHDGYPAIAQFVASSSAFFVVASVDDADREVDAVSSWYRGVDEFDGTTTTVDANLAASLSLSRFSSSSASLLLSNISLLL